MHTVDGNDAIAAVQLRRRAVGVDVDDALAREREEAFLGRHPRRRDDGDCIHERERGGYDDPQARSALHGFIVAQIARATRTPSSAADTMPPA